VLATPTAIQNLRVDAFSIVLNTHRKLPLVVADLDYNPHRAGVPERIASEATCNAFRHSGATRISVDIWYDDRPLRLRIEDNGKGIDPKVLDGGGREGHYGLPGMQERAKLAGGKLTVRSRLDSGTDIELTIPASVACTTSKRSEAPSGESGVTKTR
jgi:glucose-6-phosphate-specific signal transduction histidine kinase